MKRVLLTGMSGTGKSAILRALAEEGILTLDLDDGWIDYSLEEPLIETQRAIAFMESHRDRPVALAGCAVNQGELYAHLDAVVLLTAPIEVMRDRILARQDNPFGQREDEWQRIVEDKEETEPLLRKSADVVIDTDRPFDEVLRKIRKLLN